MPDKSYVTLEQHVCAVCGETFDTGALLLDKHLRPKFDMHTVTDFGLCKEHTRLKAEGYIFLVGIDPNKSTQPYTPRSVWRLGRDAAVKREAWGKMFNVPCPDSPLCYVGADVLAKLERISHEVDSGGRKPH